MPAVVVDSSVLISLAAGEQFDLLRIFYSTIHVPPAVWSEVISVPKRFGTKEAQQACAAVALGLLEGKIPRLRPVLELQRERTTFWLAKDVYAAVLKQVGENL